MKRILISQRGGDLSAAVLINGELDAFYSSNNNSPRLVGNIYKGRVQNCLPGMNAAFVDIGRDKNVFLQSNQNFRVGQDVLIQIEKEPVGSKGARATLNISLAGHFLIFLPTLNYVGVSGKIQGSERDRLHALAKKIRPKEAGLIVRTAAAACDEQTLLGDLDKLTAIWNRIVERNAKRKPPALLYSDNDLLDKIIRDEFSPDSQIIVDNVKLQRRLGELVPADNISFHDDAAQIFAAFGIADELKTLTQRELTWPGGGQIVFDKTEALTAVDVNTGKFIGRDNFDETILKTNLEAAEVILRQLKLRDLGGIIIVDFIDMNSDAHNRLLMNFLRQNALRDRNKTKIVDMTPLGLVEITRHRSRK